MTRHFDAPRANKRLKLSTEQRGLLRRRTIGFLDGVGLDRPLSFVLEEVYLQGMRDAAQTMEETNDTLQRSQSQSSDHLQGDSGVEWTQVDGLAWDDLLS
jgi:hypothetical protein